MEKSLVLGASRLSRLRRSACCLLRRHSLPPRGRGAGDATVYLGPRVAEVAVGDDPDAPKAVGILFCQSSLRRLTRRILSASSCSSCSKGIGFVLARGPCSDEDSPLRKLGLDVGDVVTRLDGVAVDTEKFEQDKIWQLPELENHYGPTEVKWIKQGKHLVQVGQIDLGPQAPRRRRRLLGLFEIKLLPGFKNVPIRASIVCPASWFTPTAERFITRSAPTTRRASLALGGRV